MNQLQKIRLKVFDYHEELDSFTINNQFKEVVDELRISEWSGVEWVGRYFMLDNDYGEHWFDNWDLRDLRADKVKQYGIEDDSELLIIDPTRMVNDKDGPCHTDSDRKQFWHDVLYSLELSLQTLVNECRSVARNESSELTPEEAEQSIKKVTEKYSS